MGLSLQQEQRYDNPDNAGNAIRAFRACRLPSTGNSIRAMDGLL